MADERIQRILEALDQEIERQIERARETSNTLTYHSISGEIRGLERARTIIQATK